MEKPFSVVYEEFKQSMANLINNSGLPVQVVEPILQSYLAEVSNITRNQYQIDKAKYEKSLSDKDNNVEKKDS